jgi:predicted DsbA family dithiol-disulfide isomerase
VVKVEVYSDVVCPWCYVGERRLKRALAALPDASHIDVQFMPYQLDPSTPDEASPLVRYIEHRFGRNAGAMLERVSAVANGEGISINWDRALMANTRTAHRLLTWVVQEYGAKVQGSVVEQLFDLYFTQGGNIADIEQLVQAAARASVDADRARAHLQSTDGVSELEAAFDEARRRGVQAVPTFIIDNRFIVQGAQPVAAFVDVLERALAQSTETVTPDAAACTDGECAI